MGAANGQGVVSQAVNQARAQGQQLDAGIGDGQPYTQNQGFDFYTAMNRPNYQPYGPNGQFYQPIYQPQYQNYMQPMGGVFGGYGMPMGGGMRGMGGMMQGLGMPSRGDSPIPPAPPTVPSNISQSGGIGSGGALNFTYAEGGIADLLDK